MAKIDTLCINSIRTLAADAIQKAKSGHPGMAIGAAPIGYTVFNKMKINPKNPDWQGRDRFVLSSGHASMLLYALLHINGYDLTIDDIKNFRQLDSRTPGHPEIEMTPGVDASTGPLGQGFAMAVGMAMAEAHEAAIFNRDGFNIVDNYTYVLMGDGCIMEGISSEAASLAGANKLNKLIAIYDSNSITIEGKTDITFTEDVELRFKAYGFGVFKVEDGEDIKAISNAIDLAKADTDKPSLIIVKTHIAHGTQKADMASAHGEPLGTECIAQMKKDMGWNYPEFTVPDEVYEHYSEMQKEREAEEEKYNKLLDEYKRAYPELYKQFEDYHNGITEEQLANMYRLFDNAPEGAKATRACSGDILNKLYTDCGITSLFGGSADLGPSNKTIIKPGEFFSPESYAAPNVHFGIRELAMAAVCNGIMLFGGLHAFCATFMVFTDYTKPAMRLSALMGLPVIYVMTHDSFCVGEDGPTHHPIEQLASLRATPGIDVFRPADYKETVAAYIAALTSDRPTMIALSRQDLPQYTCTGMDAMNGAYIVRDTENVPDVIIIATGSELEISLAAADMLSGDGISARVVSMPCMEIFEEQSDDYKEQVLPRKVTARVAVEAGASMPWHKYVGFDGEMVTIDHFGLSAPAKTLYREFGFTADEVVKAAKAAIENNK